MLSRIENEHEWRQREDEKESEYVWYKTIDAIIKNILGSLLIAGFLILCSFHNLGFISDGFEISFQLETCNPKKVAGSRSGTR